MDRGPDIATMFAGTSLRQPEDAVGFLLWRVAHRYQREVDRACAQVQLTHLQFVVLVLIAWLTRNGEAVTQSGLAAFSGIHPMQISAVLKALDEKKFVLRAKSRTDDRVKQTEVAPDGARVLARALPLVEEAQRRFFGNDPETGSDMHDALRRIVAKWAEESGGSP